MVCTPSFDLQMSSGSDLSGLSYEDGEQIQIIGDRHLIKTILF